MLQFENIFTSLFFSHQESDARLMYLSHQRRTTPFFEIFTAAIDNLTVNNIRNYH